MYHDLQINRLRALVTVVDLGGFRRAAEALHVTQPAISQQIRQLSSFIKQPVFLSTGRELRLSAQGEELLGYARRLVAVNDEAVERFMPSSGDARLSIGIGDQLAEALPEILQSLSYRMPHAQISVRTGLSESLEGQVVSGQLDLALLLQPRPPRTPVSHELGHLRMDWFGKPVYGEGAEVPVTLFTEPSTLRSQVVDLFNASATPWRVGYEGSELVGLRAATKAGLGVTCLIANGDRLWDLPRTGSRNLPQPPSPIPVTMAVSAGAGDPIFVRTARRVLQNALAGYPFAE
ncbi:LysR substrate-binding domain-containing protein [Luedemannella helvata]|uniref:LysR substrate-binding domain-containing protein n=1 Tax=Luedemannella helvata TaxID=349315 RepID=A0ABN2JUR8_9ACTN